MDNIEPNQTREVGELGGKCRIEEIERLMDGSFHCL